MKNLVITLFILVSGIAISQETKSKNLKLKYVMPQGWSAQEVGGKTPWEGPVSGICNCGYVLFTRPNKEGKMNVLVYPSTASGLDSAKRNAVGRMKFEDVQKYDKTKNKHFSFERKKSNFVMPSGEKSFEVMRYFAKVEDHFYIIYAWQENMNLLNSTAEKELYEMVNSIEPE